MFGVKCLQREISRESPPRCALRLQATPPLALPSFFSSSGGRFGRRRQWFRLAPLRGGQREVHPEVARAVDLRPQPAAHRRGKLTRDREPEPDSSGRRRTRRIRSVEAFEHSLRIGWVPAGRGGGRPPHPPSPPPPPF